MCRKKLAEVGCVIARVTVRAAIAQRAEEIGWHSQPRPAPKSEKIYRVMRSS